MSVYTKTDTTCEKSCKRRKVKILFLTAFMVFALMISAGCVSNDEKNEIETTDVAAPSDIIQAGLEFSKDIKNLDTAISIDIYNIAEKLAYAETKEEINKIGVDYYAQNPWIDKLIYYYDNRTKRADIPVQISAELDSYLPHPTEKEIGSAGGKIHYDCVFIPEDGYVTVECTGVYDKNGKYKGYFLFIYDLYTTLNMHQLFMGTEKSYGDYVCYFLNKNGQIVFTSKPEFTAKTVNHYLYDGIDVIKTSDEGTGAYTYKSPSFYNYNRAFNTEKITSWEKFTAYKSTYTLYLTKEVNQPPLIYENIYEVNAKQAETDVMDAYVYASANGNQALINRIDSGYYKTPMAILNYSGDVISSSDNTLPGLNFLNNHGLYGFAYTKSMVYTAQQGGGYVYYMYPVDGTIDADASQFSMAFVQPLKGDCFVFGRFSGDTDLVPTNHNIRNDITKVSREVLKESYENGVEHAISKINANPHNTKIFADNLATDVEDLGIMDMNGNIYASAYNPSVVGYTLTGYTDVYGGSSVRKMIMLAKSGGGYINELYPNPENEKLVDMWIYSIEPINDKYLIYTGAVLKTFEDISPDLAGLNIQ